jgi:hypothetical protein
MLLSQPEAAVTGWRTTHGRWTRATGSAFAARTRTRRGFSLITAIVGTAILAAVVAAIFSAGIINEHRPARNPKIAAPEPLTAEAPPPPRAGTIARESGA